MSTELTQWLQDLSHGDERAAQQFWELYFEKLVRLARRKMEGLSLRSADEEDVALSAMNSFCRGLAARRFDGIAGADELWKLLVTITARKACAQRRQHFAQKRGGGRVRGESIFDSGDNRGLGEVLGREPTPELAVGFAESCKEMIDSLQDETLQKIVLLAMEGYRTPEIAEKLGCVRRTVERKLQIIREKRGQNEKSSTIPSIMAHK